MLADLPFELVDAIAQFLSYRDLVSLKLTCKILKEHVEFVKVRCLNVFVDSLPYEGKLFHSEEPIHYAESMTACPKKIFSCAFQDRFRHLKRLTFQQKVQMSHGTFVLERDVNCFQELELRAYQINEGGCLKLKKLRVLLVETAEQARYVVDCEQLTAIHFTDIPQVVNPENLRHVSSAMLDDEEFVEFLKKCPNLTRISLSTCIFDSSLPYCSGDNFLLYRVPVRLMYWPDGLICENRLRFLERIELDASVYYPPFLRGLKENISLCEDGSPGKEVFKRLKFYIGSQDAINDEKLDELVEVINDQFEEFKNLSLRQPDKQLNLVKLTYSDLIKFQRPIEGLISDLKYITIDNKLNLARESLLYRLPNLRQLLIKGNRLDETILNQFTKQFRYLELLGFAECAIRIGDLALIPNHSVHVLMIENCTCSDLNFMKSFENVKNLYVFKLKLGKQFRFRSILEFRESFSSILKSLRYLDWLGLDTLGQLYISNPEMVLFPKKIASTIAEMKQSCFRLDDDENDFFVDDWINNHPADEREFMSLDEFIEYVFPTRESNV